MWKSPRRIALISTGVILASAGMLGIAWLADWLPIRLESPETGDVVRDDGDESALDSFPNLADGRFGGIGIDSAEVGPDEFQPDTNDSIFRDQSEPGSQTGTQGGAMANTPSQAPWTVDNLPRPPAGIADNGRSDSPGMPESFPSVTTSDEPDFSTSGSSNGPLDLTTQPHEVVDQNEYAAASARSGIGLASGEFVESETGQVFQADSPQTLPQARSFPTQVAFVDNSTDSSSPPANDSASPADNGAIGTTVTPAPTALPKIDLSETDALIASGDYVNAHRQLSEMYWNQPALQPAIMKRLEQNAELIYFRSQPHFLEAYVVQPGDLLQRIAPRYNVNWEYLAAVNNIDPKRIRPGQKLKVIKGPFSAFVDLSDFVLTIHCHGFYVKRFPIGIGKGGATPTGRFTVLDRVPDPQYTDPNGRVVAGDDPTNPLGEYWLDLGDSYGIHGTIEPDSIGKAASRGCIRMHNSDVAQVYNFLVRGSEVAIRP